MAIRASLHLRDRWSRLGNKAAIRAIGAQVEFFEDRVARTLFEGHRCPPRETDGRRIRRRLAIISTQPTHYGRRTAQLFAQKIDRAPFREVYLKHFDRADPRGL
jgi:hypothetical protein